MFRRRLRLILIVGSVLVSVAVLGTVSIASAGGAHCRTQAITTDAGVAVEVSGFCYEPTVLRIEAGQTVEWTNRDAVPHTVSGANGAWGDFTQFGDEESIRFSFPTAGAFPYYCVLHPGMIGTVLVGVAEPTSGSITATDPVVAVSGSATSSSIGSMNVTGLGLVVLASLAAGAFLGVVRLR